MKEKMISIIMPTYNDQKYIKQAIESVINQSFGFEKIELIIVDDCSTDNTFQILNDYIKQYDNIIYFKTDCNSKVAGKPRNLGIKKATGEYLMFLDSDDYFEKDACKIMYDCIEEKKLKFVTANGKMVDEEGIYLGREYNDVKIFPSQKLDENDLETVFRIMRLTASCKIVEREYILKNQIYFLENLPAEDGYFTMKLFFLLKETFYLKNPIFCYRQRNLKQASVSNNLNIEYFEKLYKANEETYKLYLKYNKNRLYEYYYFKSTIYYLYKLFCSTKISLNDKTKLLLNMKEYFDRISIFNIDINKVNDKFGILECFSISTKVEISKYFKKMDYLFETVSFKEINCNKELIIDDLYKQIM